MTAGPFNDDFRRVFRPLLLLLPVLFACGPQAPAPDVVLVVVDTLRADRTAAVAPGLATTPRLEELSRRGAVYQQAVAPSSWTIPSMAALFAGRDVTRSRRTAFEGDVHLAERFADAGYATIGIVANPLLASENGFTRGFESYELAPARSTASLESNVHELRAWDAGALVRRALAELDRADPDRPVFLYLHLMDTHVPYDPAWERRAPRSPGWSDAPLSVPWTDALSDEQAALLSAWRRAYDGQVSFVDEALGRLVDNLDGLRDREWVVAITSDHGEGLFSHERNPDNEHGAGLLAGGYDDHGEHVYEEAVRVPMWLLGAGVTSGYVEARPVAMHDLHGTLLDLAGIGSGGQRRLPLSSRDPAPAIVLGTGTRAWFARTADRKLEVPFPGRADVPGVADRLWAVGLEIEPETEDLSMAEAGRLDDLRDLLERWREENAETEADTDPATLERLETLGYVR